MRFLWRNAIFILFPAVLVSIVFLAQISFGTAMRFGQWGERSIVESALLVARDKIERVEQTISRYNAVYFGMIDPSSIDDSCQRWMSGLNAESLVEAAAIIDDFGEIAVLFHRDRSRAPALSKLIESEIAPVIDSYDSFYRYKQIHRKFGGDYRLVTHFTTEFEGRDYTTLLIYNNGAVMDKTFEELLGNLGEGRVANVVDDGNQIIYGHSIDEAEEFVVAHRFPTTFYKWRFQIAPESKMLFKSKVENTRFSKTMLIALALGVTIFGIVALYLSIVRERRLNRLKSEFIANVSHELKTPLSLIRMFSELLAMGKVSEEKREKQYHQIILRETERLSSLIDNVLDFAKIERGKSAYDFKLMDVPEVVERGVEIYRHQLEKSGIKLLYSAAQDLPQARIDDHAITLAVINLVDNAAKYAKGTDVVGVEMYRRDGMIHIDVYDHGVGIPVGHSKRVFERFYRVPTEEVRKHRGSGIGLSLVRHIAKSHNGEVVMTSKPGEETRFSVRLPAVVTDKSPARAPTQADAPGLGD